MVRVCRAFSLTLLAACLATNGHAARGDRSDDLTNVFLSPALSQWLVGAIGRMATEEEIDEYLAIGSAAEAEVFVERFWERRDDDPSILGNRTRRLFDERQEIADEKYSESAYPGRRTARGIIYTLYGPPDEIDYEVPKVEGGESVEKWIYPKGSPEGLDSKKPLRAYRFVRDGDLTVFYDASMDRKARRKRLPRLGASPR